MGFKEELFSFSVETDFEVVVFELSFATTGTELGFEVVFWVKTKLRASITTHNNKTASDKKRAVFDETLFLRLLFLIWEFFEFLEEDLVFFCFCSIVDKYYPFYTKGVKKKRLPIYRQPFFKKLIKLYLN